MRPSANPMGVEFFGASRDGIHLRLAQDRGITAEITISTESIHDCLQAIALDDPNLGETLAYQLLGGVANARRKESS